MAKARKSLTEFMVPTAGGWQRWQSVDGGATACVDDALATEQGASFGKASQQRVLVVPVAHAWVVPAWLKGDEAYLKDMALLHLERLGVKVEEPERGMMLRLATVKGDARLIAMVVLKDNPTPLAMTSLLPTKTTVSALALPLVPNGITVWRELGRLVFAITMGDQLVYASPITSTHFDERALSELNNACLQLGFQGVLGKVERLMLWLEEGEGDEQMIAAQTGLKVEREPVQPWQADGGPESSLLTADVKAAQHLQDTRSRQRLMALSAGALAAAAIAIFTVLISSASRERDMLREKVAEVSPRAARVLDQRNSWMEVAPAVDPSAGPMQLLLHLLEPEAAKEVTLMHFEFTPERTVLRGHTPTPTQALLFTQQVQESEHLFAYDWEAPSPELGQDGSATFELKGDRP